MLPNIDPEDILLEESDTKGRFYYKSGSDLAEMTFTKAGDGLMIIDHTHVANAFGGKGLGVLLLEKGVKFARHTRRKVVPLCPYAAHQFRKHPEWQDILGN